MSKMRKFMSIEEFEQTAEKCKEAVNKGDYEEAGKLNEALYESAFTRYEALIRVKRKLMEKRDALEGLFGQSSFETEIKGLDLRINGAVINLEGLLKVGFNLLDLRIEGRQK